MASEAHQLTINSSNEDGTLVFVLTGRLDSQTSQSAEQALTAATQPNPRVLLDCSRVTFLSSAGVRAIIMAHRGAKEHGGKFAVYCPTPEILETIHITGIHKVIAVFADRSKAIETLRA